jgi:hypothetical protein
MRSAHQQQNSSLGTVLQGATVELLTVNRGHEYRQKVLVAAWGIHACIDMSMVRGLILQETALTAPTAAVTSAQFQPARS